MDVAGLIITVILSIIVFILFICNIVLSVKVFSSHQDTQIENLIHGEHKKIVYYNKGGKSYKRSVRIAFAKHIYRNLSIIQNLKFIMGNGDYKCIGSLTYAAQINHDPFRGGRFYQILQIDEPNLYDIVNDVDAEHAIKALEKYLKDILPDESYLFFYWDLVDYGTDFYKIENVLYSKEFEDIYNKDLSSLLQNII